jgi:hypothetical protein
MEPEEEGQEERTILRTFDFFEDGNACPGINPKTDVRPTKSSLFHPLAAFQRLDQEYAPA